MRAIAIDDEPIALQGIISQLNKIPQISQATGFSQPEKLLDYLRDNVADVAFLDVSMRAMDGLTLATQLHGLCPSCAIIFVTGYSEYAVDAFKARASGYLLKPVTQEDIRIELDNLRPAPPGRAAQLRLQCFGNFEVFVGTAPLKFQYSKTKELLAYLVDRRGSALTTGDLIAVLWEDQPCSQVIKSQLRNLVADLCHTLEEAGVRDALLKSRNSFAIDANKVRCDYYEFLDARPYASHRYMGEYMTQYSWAEFTSQYLVQSEKED